VRQEERAQLSRVVCQAKPAATHRHGQTVSECDSSQTAGTQDAGTDASLLDQRQR